MVGTFPDVAHFLAWVIANMIAGAVIGAGMGVPGYLGTVVTAALAGVPQALALRYYGLQRTGAWIVQTIAAVLVGLGVGTALGVSLVMQTIPDQYLLEVGPVVATATAIGIAGVCVGVAQWFILRTRVQRASLWIPATIIGSLVFVPVVVWTPATADGYSASYIVTGLLAGMLYGGVTSAFLSKFLLNPS